MINKQRILISMFFLLGLSNTYAGCPELSWWEFPSGNSTSSFVKRVNTKRTKRKTIFFCKQPGVDSYTQVDFTKAEFIGGSNEVISLDNPNDKVLPIGTGSVTISGGGVVGNYQLNELGSKTLANQNIGPWGEPTIWHFFKRVYGNSYYDCTWNIHASIRNYLRNHASIFTTVGGGQAAVVETAHSWDIAKITDLEFRNANGKIVKGDLSFYWYQNRNSGGGYSTGGNWQAGVHRVCHFAVAAELKVKTNYHGSAYNIEESGNYNVSIGVRTRN